MKRIFTLVLCALLLCGTAFAVCANAAAIKKGDTIEDLTEAQRLDIIAESWIQTCTANADACADGLAIYALGELTGVSEDALKELYRPLKDGIVDGITGVEDVQIKIDVVDIVKVLGEEKLGNAFQSALTDYCNNADAEFGDPGWELKVESQTKANEILREGEVAEGVTIADIIKENYSFLLGMGACLAARDCFDDAMNADNLTDKRNNMLAGACLATFGCEMSIENADEIVKAPYTSEEIKFDREAQLDIMANIANNAADAMGELVPQIKLARSVIEITTDVAVKMMSMRGKLDALAGYMMNPDTIVQDESGYYDALSNQYGEYTFSISDMEVTMDAYNGYLLEEADYKNVVIHEAIYGLPVVAFGGVFADGLDITEITIPSTIRSRALSAVIKDCDKLEKVHYNAIDCKGWYLFYFFDGCDSDFKIEFGPGIKSIPERFIARCGITSITFPEGITTIHSGALVECPNLKTVSIPSTVETFDIAFGGVAIVDTCPKLEKVEYKAKNATGSYYNSIFADCGNEAEEMTLIFGKDIVTTPVNFLNNCGVKTVTFPEGIKKIREYAITGCQRLETITIPSSVVRFNENLATDYVFGQCNNLKTVNYNAPNVEGEVGAYIFYEIESDFHVNFGKGIVEIPENFVYKCGLTQIAFPEGVQTIRHNCLVDCDALKTVTVPTTAETIEYQFVTQCDNVETIYFNANCTSAPTSALISDSGNFANPGMKVLLGKNVTTVPKNFINNCAIVDFVYPEGVKVIRSKSLANCDALKIVTIPTTVEQAEHRVVTDCDNLQSIIYKARNAVYGGDYYYLFYNSGNASGLELHFTDTVEALPNRFMGNCGVRSVVLPDGITAIPERTICDCAYLTSLTIPEGITSIAAEAFYDCQNLTEIHYNAINVKDLKAAQCAFSNAGENGNGITVFVGKKVTRIPGNLFYSSSSKLGAPKITSVKFAEGCVCKEIGKAAFANCVSLPAIRIPDSVTTIGKEAFQKCTALTDVTIGKGVTNIDDAAFSDCTSLISITIPDNITTMGKAVFADCTALKNVTIGSGVTQIAVKTFQGCTALTGISIPGQVTVIDSMAFNGCTALTTISMRDSISKISMAAFNNCSALKTVIYCGTEAQWNQINITNYENKALINANRQYHDWVKDPDTGRIYCRICLLSQCDALGHTWKDATCTSAKTCTTCSVTEGSPNGHTWRKATCTSPKTCTVCKTTEGKALGHNWKAATCDKPKICTRCKASSGRPAGHIYTDGVDGTCNVCGIHRETTEQRTVMHMFRMFDPNSGEHFYTGSEAERDFLVSVGWNYEGVGFTFSRTTGMPVYRLYDPVYGEHLYTMDVAERDMLIAQGWNIEGVAFNSAYDTEVPQYRLHNPNAKRGAYHFTASIAERDMLIALGWEYQGIGFYSAWK